MEKEVCGHPYYYSLLKNARYFLAFGDARTPDDTFCDKKILGIGLSFLREPLSMASYARSSHDSRGVELDVLVSSILCSRWKFIGSRCKICFFEKKEKNVVRPCTSGFCQASKQDVVFIKQFL